MLHTLVIAMALLFAPSPQDEPTVGEELAQDASVPEALAALFAHVGDNMSVHARWAASAGTAVAKRESEALEQVARAYRDIAEAGRRAAAAMRAMKDVPSAPRDPNKLDRAAQVQWMRRKIELQRAFANIVLEHAAVSEKVLAEMEAAAPKGR